MFKDWTTYRPKSVEVSATANNKSDSRLTAFDMLRLFAMVMMIQGHVIFEMTESGAINPAYFPWNIWEFFRGLTAPLFLTISGAVQVFANKRDESGRILPSVVKKRFRMAVIIIAIGYFLVFPASRIYHLPFIDNATWSQFFQVNILQLIGLSLLLMLGLFYITRTVKTFGLVSFAISIIIFALTPIVLSSNVASVLPAWLSPYFSQQNGSIFTVFPFSGFMFFGGGFGALIKSIETGKREKAIFKYSVFISLALIVLSYPVYTFIESLNLNFIEYLKGNAGYSLFRLGCVFAALAAAVKLSGFLKKYSDILSLFGKKALFVYVAHLILLYGTPWSISIAQLYSKSMPLYASVLLALVIISISLASAWLYNFSIAKMPNAKLFYKYSLGAIIAFLLLI